MCSWRCSHFFLVRSCAHSFLMFAVPFNVFALCGEMFIFLSIIFSFFFLIFVRLIQSAMSECMSRWCDWVLHREIQVTDTTTIESTHKRVRSAWSSATLSLRYSHKMKCRTKSRKTAVPETKFNAANDTLGEYHGSFGRTRPIWYFASHCDVIIIKGDILPVTRPIDVYRVFRSLRN